MSIDAAIAAIPEGWRIYTIDMSIEGRTRVMLKGPMYLNAAGLTILVLAFAASVGAVIATVWPNRHKIIAALSGRGGDHG